MGSYGPSCEAIGSYGPTCGAMGSYGTSSAVIGSYGTSCGAMGSYMPEPSCVATFELLVISDVIRELSSMTILSSKIFS